MTIELGSHTDCRSSYESNMKLSDKRAKASASYIVSKGISPERVEAVGFGETKPIATNLTEDGRGENRRVEFHLVRAD